MKPFEAIIGFAIGSYLVAIADWATAVEAWRLFFFVSGGYVFGRVFP